MREDRKQDMKERKKHNEREREDAAESRNRS